MRLTSIPATFSTHAALRRRLTPLRASFALGTAMALIFFLDRLTGLAPVQHLYYLPIIVAGIRFGARGGVAIGAAAIFLYHLANFHQPAFHYEEADILQMVVFVAMGIVSAKLADDARRLHGLATTDDLTGLHNLRSFELELRKMVTAARAAKTPLSLLVLDLDRLKSLNDVHGHLAGAEAVRTVGRTIGACIPTDAVACRYGGDEFVIALPRPAPAALVVADDLRAAVQREAPLLAGVQFPEKTLSISVGVACRSFDDAALARTSSTSDEVGEALFRAADAALYVAKTGGRNRAHVA
jgi:diguanylate cyclase (GGDEF)-like protein